MDLPTPDTVFRVANGAAAIGWLTLAVSPAGTRRAPTVRRITGRALPLIFAAVYVLMLWRHWVPGAGFDSVAAVQRLFAEPGLLVAGWLHYLAFDLFVGSWIAERAAATAMPHAVLLPLLALTFLFGPAGLLAYAALRASVFRRAEAPGAAMAS